MTTFQPGVPATDEYSPAAAGYVGKAGAVADPLGKLDDQLAEVLSLLEPLDEAQQLHRYAPGKWSVKDMLGHMIDTERIFAYRALRIARADATPLPGFEQDDYVAAAGTEACEWSELLEEFQHVRRASILLLRHLPEAAWMRRGVASNHPVTVRALAYIIIGHVTHHLDILRERYLVG
jgi:uncharacterized damage-inducible protein DinB